MKNTDEAKKVQKKDGAMYWAVYEKIRPIITTIEELIKVLD